MMHQKKHNTLFLRSRYLHRFDCSLFSRIEKNEYITIYLFHVQHNVDEKDLKGTHFYILWAPQWSSVTIENILSKGIKAALHIKCGPICRTIL